MSPGLRDIERLSAFLAFLLVLAAQLLYAVHFYKPHFQSDDAVLNMLAESMWEQRSLFPHGWMTNNGDLMVPSGALLMAPLLEWLPSGFRAHSVAGVFAIGLMLVAFTGFLRQGVQDRAVLLVAAAACISGLSWWCAHPVYQQTTYVWWPAGFFAGSFLIWKWRNCVPPAEAPSWAGVLLFLLVFVVCFANPMRTIVMLVFPLYMFDRALAASIGTRGASIATSWLDRMGLRDRFVVGAMGGGFIAAALAYEILLRAGLVATLHGASNLHWAGWGAVVRHLDLFLSGWFPLLGASPAHIGLGAGLAAGILEAGRLVLAVWLTWVAIAEASAIHRQRNALRRALAVAFLAAFVPVLVIYVFLAPLAVDLTTMRYFIVPLFILIALAALRVADSPLRQQPAVAAGIIAASVLVVVTSAQRFVFHAGQPWSDFWRITPSATMKLGDTLRREGLEWGYATWWNAGATTVLSDGAVRVNPVTLSAGEIRPYSVMVQEAWYATQSRVGETFLALDASESTDENMRALQVSVGVPRRVVQAPNHRVLVYGHNIMGCTLRTAMSDKLDASRAAADLDVTGLQRAADGTGGTVVVAARNETGVRLSGTGPYPISIGMRLLDSTGAVRDADWVHHPLNCDLQPGEEGRFVVPLPAISDGRWTIEVDLVQEGVAWFHHWGRPVRSFELANEAGAVRPGEKP